jgi:hypothetical protein
MRTNPAMRDHFAWLDNMKKLLANPHMDAISKHLKRERDQMARAVDSLKLNLKEIR